MAKKRVSVPLAVSLLGLLLLTGSADSDAADPAQVLAVPSRRAPRVGETFKVAVRVRNAANIGSVPFTLLYDPSLVEFLPGTAVEGRFLGADGSGTSFLATSAPRPGGTTGVVVGHSRLRADRGVDGRGTLCRIAFRVKAPGVATFTFSRAAVLDPSALPLQATFTGAAVTLRPER